MTDSSPQPEAVILVGDVRSRLLELADGSVQTCITSPPYWGLRDYGTASWVHGDPSCDHLGKPMATKANINTNCGTGTDRKNADAREPFGATCGKCGAERVDSQIGLEADPDAYVKEMVGAFAEVRRVLADDGTLWLNLGDSYGNPSAGRNDGNHRADGRAGGMSFKAVGTAKFVGDSVRPKNLVGIPWRVAFALQADGWYLRQDIIWAKPNPMPESVTDRCTKSHEYLFLLSKSARYYFDNEAIKEPMARRSPGARTYGESGQRNKRDVWTIPTQAFKGAHFAVMPEALVEPCVLAGSREGDTVLDPFAGSGTVGVVALRHQRSFVGVELNPEYAEMARLRITDDAPLLNSASLRSRLETKEQ